jgi:hypothetical protein
MWIETFTNISIYSRYSRIFMGTRPVDRTMEEDEPDVEAGSAAVSRTEADHGQSRADHRVNPHP